MRPLNLGETLDASIKVVRRSWRTLALVMVVVALPLQLLDLLVISATTDTYQVGSTTFSTDTSGSRTTYGDEDVFVAGQLAIVALSVLGYLLGTVACYRAIVDTHLGRPTSARASLAFAARRLGATLWLSILYGLGLIAALIAFVIPFLWLAVAWSVAFPVLLVEGAGGAQALARSFRLVQGRWWATLGRLFVAYVLVAVVTGVATLVLFVPALALVDDTSFAALLLEHVANLVVSLVTTPFIAAVTVLVYFDLRARKEGFDPARLAEAGVADTDAFGAPVAPRPESVAPQGGAPAPGPARWAPPVAPEARRPSPPGS